MLTHSSLVTRHSSLVTIFMLIGTQISREARAVFAETPPGPVLPKVLVAVNITRPAPAVMVAAALRTDRAPLVAQSASLGPAKAVVIDNIGRKARTPFNGGIFLVVRGGIAATGNLLKGDGTGNAADSGIAPGNVVQKNPGFPTPADENAIVACLQAAGLCA